MTIKEMLEQNARNSIVLDIAGQAKTERGATRFGGQPDVPHGFVWPTFEGTSIFDDITKIRPLAFLAQFDCAQIAAYDSDHLLPGHGLLSFFYEAEAQPWGYDPKDRGCARVFWFEDSAALAPADFPADLPDSLRFPEIGIGAERALSYPDWEDMGALFPEMDLGSMEAVRTELGISDPGRCSKLLGWPDTIQGSMPIECELTQRGYYLGGSWQGIPGEVKRQAKEIAPDKWRLLFQLDVVAQGNFELMFGDCGRLYFFIPKEDLRARRFDQVWLILQCG